MLAKVGKSRAAFLCVVECYGVSVNTKQRISHSLFLREGRMDVVLKDQDLSHSRTAAENTGERIDLRIYVYL